MILFNRLKNSSFPLSFIDDTEAKNCDYIYGDHYFKVKKYVAIFMEIKKNLILIFIVTIFHSLKVFLLPNKFLINFINFIIF